MAGTSEASQMRYIASPSDSLEQPVLQPVRGDLYTWHSYIHSLPLLIQTHAARQARNGREQRLKCYPKTSSWRYLIFIDWTPWRRPGKVRGSGTALYMSVESGGMLFPCRHIVWTCGFSANMGHLLKVSWLPGRPCP